MAVHFVNFRGDEYVRAVRIWGRPDFVHPVWDARAKYGGELHPDDVVVFAKGSEEEPLVKFTWDDSQRF